MKDKLRISQIFAVVVVFSMFAMFVPAIAATTLNTTRIYSEKLGAGAGQWVPGENVSYRINDTITGIPDEQQPYNTTVTVNWDTGLVTYAGVSSIFDPSDCCAPRKDSITFNPVFISEMDDDNSELRLSGLARNISIGQDATEKVFFRQWYEPDYFDKDLDISGWITYRISPGKLGEELEDSYPLIGSDDVLSNNYITAGPDGVLDSIVGDNDGDGAIEVPETHDFVQMVPKTLQDEHYPAIVQEFTYMFTMPGPLSSETRPVSGPTGSTFVFPVGQKEDLFNDTCPDCFGYGLTSLDPTFNGVDDPSVVEIQTEHSLEELTGIEADFNGNGTINGLDDDGQQLSGDELLILSLPEINVTKGNVTQFLDHAVVVEEVYQASTPQIKLGVYYTGDLEPKFIGHIMLGIGDMVLMGTKPTYTFIPAGGSNIGTMPKGPFYVYIESIDDETNSVVLKLGRAVGATHSAMEQAPGTPDQKPGDPYWLKRFYVDGHEYNVVAIYSDPQNHENFKFITIRTPIPKEGEDLDPVVLIEQHSVRLQPYEKNRALSVMPPYNYEHTELTDVQVWNATEELTRLNESKFKAPGFFVGSSYVAKPIYPAPAEYRTIDSLHRRIDIYVEDLMFYVDEAQEPQLKGELKEKYNENRTWILGNQAVDEYWYVEQFQSRPDLFTEFYLPVGHGLYLITLNYETDESLFAYAKYKPGNGGDIIFDPGWVYENGRVMFWYDPLNGGKKFKDEESIRLYGSSFDESEYVLEDRCGIDGCEAIPEIAAMNPKFPINLTDLVRAGDLGEADPVTGAFVEDAPYTDHISIFNPQGHQAYPYSILTVDPAWMDEYLSADELKELGLYAKISFEGNDAREKVFSRMWYEPFHLDMNADNDSVLNNDSNDDWYPAVMQEYTYMLVGVDNQPAHGQPGETLIAFPMGTQGWQLDENNPGYPPGPGPGADKIWGYGLTTFDPLPYDGVDEADTVTIHSEQTLKNLTNLSIDFNGNGSIDPLDNDTLQFSGDELVIPTLTLNLKQNDRAQFLDYMIKVDSVQDGGAGGSGNPKVTLRFYKLGTLSGAPDDIGSRALRPLEAVTVGLNGINPTITAGGGDTGAGMDDHGPWFVYVNAVNPRSNNVAVTIGRALGATHTAMMEGVDELDMTPGDPYYLKRFYVDGHEYNVVAIKTEPTDVPGSDDPMEFKFITIRTPVQKVETAIVLPSFSSQSYWKDMPADTQLYVMPPFNFEHTGRKDIQDGWLPPEILMDPLGFMGPVEKHKAALNATIVEEDIEEQFLGDLKELYADNTTDDLNNHTESWYKLVFWTTPFRYTDIRINAPDEKYLMKLGWWAPQGIFQTVNFDNDRNNSDPDFVKLSTCDVNDALDGNSPCLTPNVKFWYDINDTTDLYVNSKSVGLVNVHGFVNDVAGKFDGLYNVTVTISNLSGFVGNDTTDFIGRYDLGDINPGEYTITASKMDFITETQVVTLTTSGEVKIDFTLEHGLIPVKPNTDYVMRAIKLWYKNEISLTKVLNVIAAWSS